MQIVLTYLTLLFTGIMLQAQNNVEVSMKGFDNNEGKAMIALYDSEENFLEKRYQGQHATIIDKKAKITFADIPDGTYAISVVHDEDNNGELNMVMGIYPSEAVGTSNNAAARFGPPKWDDAKFEVRSGKLVTMEINL